MKSSPWYPNINPRLPITTPAMSSPRTAGWETRSAISPPILAATRTMIRARRTGVTGLWCPAA